ncbi:hypothetical protein DENIS_4373 [Desulfonema ishimotonii]|uniref:Antirepressor protein ant N-terminal domain-containing protein n=1 Tax=Desulfonema ishimotonii TaxID=45657 RepID=A0A401G2B9_9BACT|nr:phage antirepressor N-terminal domain-containing protein [Desulfonema ishimotonii]GBC63379.1 hypothetical protein DENIS_4373 [Desulfonema ishimotonii]
MNNSLISQAQAENQPIPATVKFHDHDLITIEKDGTYFVALKPICEGIGLDWESQRQLIQRDLVLKEGTCIIQVPSAGGLQEAVCLPLHYLNGWLFKINASRYRGGRRETIIQYQKECYTQRRHNLRFCYSERM